MSGIQLFPGSGGGSPSNPTYTYEPIGFTSTGAGTTVTAGSPAHNKGSYTASLGTTANNWVGFIVYCGPVSSANVRYMLDISFDDGTTDKISNLFFVLGSTTQALTMFIPVKANSGSIIKARCQASTASATFNIAIEGVVAAGSVAPGYTSMTGISLDTGNTRPSTTNVPFDDDGSSGWTQLIASTAATYNAIIAVADGNGTAFGTTQPASIFLATGAAASEVEFGRWFAVANTASGFNRGFPGAPFYLDIASGTRISAQIRAATPGTDNGRIGIYGLVT